MKDRMLGEGSHEEQQDLHDDYLATMESKSFSPINEIGEDSGYGLWHDEVKAWMDINTLKGLFFNDDWVFILIDRIATKIASQEIRVMIETVKDGVATYAPDENHPIQKLLYEPNVNQTYYQWMYSIVADHSLTGNAVIYKPQNIPALVHIPVEMIQLDFDTNGQLKAYRVVQYNTNYELPVPREVMNIDPSLIAHIRRPNPSSALWGLSPFVPARRNILFNRYSTEYLNNFYLKGAQPGIVLNLDDTANEKAALRLLRSMEIAHTGRKNQRRNMVLPKGVKATSLNQSLADQQLKDYIMLNRETIINILQVPKHELSIAEAGSLGSEEYKTALRNFWSGPLKSIMRSIEASLNKLFKDELGQGRCLEFNLTDVEILQEDLNQKADLAVKMLQTHTLNEVRAHIFNDEPLPGGDETPLAKPYPVLAPPLPHLNSAPAAPETKEEPMMEEELKPSNPADDERCKVLDNNKKAISSLKEANPDWWNKRQSTLSKDEAQRFGDFHSAVLSLFLNQTLAAVKSVKKNLRVQGFKAYGQKDEFNKAKLKRDIEDALAKYGDQYQSATLPILQTTLGLGYDAQMTLPFGLPNKTQIEAVRAKREQSRADMLENNSYETFKQINQTSTDNIMSIIEEGVTNGRTLDEISKNIIDDASNPVNVDARAMMITRTEVLSASSIGQSAAMQDAATVLPNLKKIWLNAGDDRVRGNKSKGGADHWVLGGEMVDQDAAFSNGLMFPRDPNGGPDEVINCFIETTEIQSHSVLNAFKRLYQGPIVTIKFGSGQELTGTPNHPMLTSKGWVALGELNKGHKLIKASISNGTIPCDNNIGRVPSQFGKFFTAFSESRDVKGITGGVMDFHGDGTSSDIQVVCGNSVLVDSWNTNGSKPMNNFYLPDANLAQASLLAFSRKNESSCGVAPSHSSISPSNLETPFVDILTGPLDDFCGGSSTPSETELTHSISEKFPANIEAVRKFVDTNGFADVTFMDIEDVIVSDMFVGHVYNLSTVNEMYLVNGLIAHNCRCDFTFFSSKDAEALGIQALQSDLNDLQGSDN